ncbi:hypothetical protein ACFLV0_03185 [Chloroflexota bacterium]
MDTDNVFVASSAYKKDEDILTSCFLFVLQCLWNKQPIACCRLLQDLTGKQFTEDEKVQFRMHPYYNARYGKRRVNVNKNTLKQQERTDKLVSISDLEIASEKKCIWVEVKDRAPLTQNLLTYGSNLEEHAEKRIPVLVLLRRGYVDPQQLKAIEGKWSFRDVNWFRAYHWLKALKELESVLDDSLTSYIVTQFLGFLELKGVWEMEKITVDGVELGLKQISQLLKILREQASDVMQDLGLRPQGRPYFDVDNGVMGFPLGKGKVKECYWVEVWLDSPKELRLIGAEDKIRKTENRGIDMEVFNRKANNGQMEIVEDYYLVSKRSLEKLFQAEDDKTRLDEVSTLLMEMKQDFEDIKKRKYEKRDN